MGKEYFFSAIVCVMSIIADFVVAEVVPQSFGTQVSYNVQDIELAEVAQLGLKNLRMVVDPNNPNWARTQPIISYLWSQGVTPFFILIGDVNHPPRNSSDWNVFAAASANLAKQVSDLNPEGAIVWEIWNEPDNPIFWGASPNPAQYAGLAAATAAAIKETGVSHLIVGPSVSNIYPRGRGLAFLKQVFALAPSLLNNLGAISVHGYGPRGNEPPESRFQDYAAVEQIINSHGRTLPVILSEWGWWVSGGGAVSSTTQAEYFSRLFLGNLMMGIPITIAYAWRAGGSNAADAGVGFVDVNFQPRPAYFASARIIQALAGFSYSHRLRSSGNDYLLIFKAPDGSAKLAAWTTDHAHVAQIRNGRQKIKVAVSTMPSIQNMPGNL